MSFEQIQRFFEYGTREFIYFLYRVYRPYKVRKIRHKEEITVLFVLTEISTWKTEVLYKALLSHNRFAPILGVSYSVTVPEAKFDLVDYLKNKGYPYIDLDSNVSYSNRIKPDIVFYQKPYDVEFRREQVFDRHLNALFCYCIYGFNTVNEKWAINQPLMKYAWKIFYENEQLAIEHRPFLTRNKKAIVPTGLPMMDILAQDKYNFPDPWMPDGKKRIIYAPHHSIATLASKGLSYGTFLEFGEYIQEMCLAYKDKVQFVFKPHPLLKGKLYQLWGKERTDMYYRRWETMENSQVIEGEYVGLFKHSDAMIHDCSSFQIEYHYSHNPVLFLLKDDFSQENLSCLALQAYNCHYKGKSKIDIETFIMNVINGTDSLKSQRESFFSNNLLPPNGLSACDNIIKEILKE